MPFRMVQNRPASEGFDNLYEDGDMVLQSEFVAKWADRSAWPLLVMRCNQSVCVAYLQKRQIVRTTFRDYSFRL